MEAARLGGLPVKTLPGLTELVSGDLDLIRQLRPVEVEDVLGREPVEVDLVAIAGYVSGEIVMVTGAGGSIGSELCRQLARLGPARLVLVDHCGAGAVRDRPRAHARTRLPRRRPGRRRRQGRRQDAPGLRQVPAGGRLPCGGVQARRDDGGQPDRGRPQQHARHANARRRRRRVRHEAVRARLDRQGGESEDDHGAVEGALRVDRRDLRPPVGRRRRASWRCASATSSARPAR